MLKNKVREFLKLTQMNKTKFCHGCGVSYTTINSWLSSERELGRESEWKIRTYMTDTVLKLMELSKSEL